MWFFATGRRSQFTDSNARMVSPGIALERNDFRLVGKELAQPFCERAHRLV
jgi:hypothetical protein